MYIHTCTYYIQQSRLAIDNICVQLRFQAFVWKYSGGGESEHCLSGSEGSCLPRARSFSSFLRFAPQVGRADLEQSTYTHLQLPQTFLFSWKFQGHDSCFFFLFFFFLANRIQTASCLCRLLLHHLLVPIGGDERMIMVCRVDDICRFLPDRLPSWNRSSPLRCSIYVIN